MAIEATTGWRWVWRELSALGLRCAAGQTGAGAGTTADRETDHLDAHSLTRLLAKEMLPEPSIPPEEIQQLRDRTRLRCVLADDRRR